MPSTFPFNSFKVPRTASPALEKALLILAEDVQSDDGVANAAILEGAHRIAELRELLLECAPHVLASAEAEHLVDGFRRQRRPLDDLVGRLNAELVS